jgi:hypothetical protein
MNSQNSQVRKSWFHKKQLRFFIFLSIFMALITAVYIYFVPRTLLHNEKWMMKADKKDIRNLCHLTLLWGAEHDAAVLLIRIGDRSSVPFLLWSMPSQRSDYMGITHCTDDHFYEALSMITNQYAGDKKSDWMSWYAKNWNKSTDEWWQDGFKKAGCTVSMKGDKDSIHSLFYLLGDREEREFGNDFVLSNGVFTLSRFAHSDTMKVLEEIIHSGSDKEKKGTEKFWVYCVMRYRGERGGQYSTILKEMLELNPAFSNIRNREKETLLHEAAAIDDCPLATMLIDRGADINARNQYGSAPLHKAVYRGHARMVELLLSKGAEINVKDKEGMTPLFEAYESAAMTDMLLKHGAGMNARSSKGDTPLHHAVFGAYEGSLKVLIQRGADMNARNEKGETPMNVAIEHGRKAAAAVLQSHGAK